MRKWVFNSLILGTRFQFIDKQDQVWVKLGHNLIAWWDTEQQLGIAYFQKKRNLTEEEIYNTEVVVL